MLLTEMKFRERLLATPADSLQVGSLHNNCGSGEQHRQAPLLLSNKAVTRMAAVEFNSTVNFLRATATAELLLPNIYVQGVV